MYVQPSSLDVIQVPKQPINDIDVYLKPLVDDIKLFWEEKDAPMWDDEDKNETFNV
jgi:hypothetical protein